MEWMTIFSLIQNAGQLGSVYLNFDLMTSMSYLYLKYFVMHSISSLCLTDLMHLATTGLSTAHSLSSVYTLLTLLSLGDIMNKSNQKHISNAALTWFAPNPSLCLSLLYAPYANFLVFLPVCRRHIKHLVQCETDDFCPRFHHLYWHL